MGWNAVGGPVEPKSGLDLALSRSPCLKDASSLSDQNHVAKRTPTAEPIFGGLTATVVVASNVYQKQERLHTTVPWGTTMKQVRRDSIH
jgi:hypothetical protein